MQRDLVNRRNVPVEHQPAPHSVLGCRIGPEPGGHADSECDGFSLRENQCHVLEQEARRGNVEHTVVRVCQGRLSSQMLAFIQAQPSVVERILRHIETPPFVDLLVRVIQLDEQPAGAGVLEVCTNSFMGDVT